MDRMCGTGREAQQRRASAVSGQGAGRVVKDRSRPRSAQKRKWESAALKPGLWNWPRSQAKRERFRAQSARSTVVGPSCFASLLASWRRLFFSPSDAE